MATLRSLLSWRSLFFVLALINAKNLPFAWHVRFFYHFARNMRRPPFVKQTLSQSTEATLHPIFRAISIFSRAPLFETDYNLHKSNSTYFSDLDMSRTALVTTLLSAGFRAGNQELEKQGHRGPIGVMLGGVHTTYHKEIKPYELYEVRSRVLGWDQKWIIILSTFIRPRQGKKDEVVLATALSKYVVKKARFTLPPERCLAVAGWFEGMDRPVVAEPTKEENNDGEKKLKGILKQPSTKLNDVTPSPSDSGILVNRPHEEELQAVDIAKLEAKAEEMSAQVDVKWGEGLGTLVAAPAETAQIATEAVERTTSREDPGKSKSASVQPWTWDMIEKERKRGLEVARGWMALDAALAQESARVLS